MSAELLLAIGTPAGFAILLAGVLIWLGKSAWPQFLRELSGGFKSLDTRLSALERNDRIRMKAGYTRELREQGFDAETAKLMVMEMFGNGDQEKH